MIGKLQVWRGEHRKDVPKVGGFVSFEDLDRKPGKPPSPSKTTRKRAPRLSIGRRSFSLGQPKPGEDPFSAQAASQDLSLFSNIPAATSASVDRPPSSSGFQHSPPRPRTADPDPTTLARLRSRTSPPIPSEAQRLPWADKPLPLTIDFDQSRKRSLSITSQRPSLQSPQDEKSSYGASLSRPKTSSGAESAPGRRKRSGSFSRPPAPAPVYSLTPTITPIHSRRPSTSGTSVIQSQRASRETLNKTNSTASSNNGPLGGHRSVSRASTQTTPKANMAPSVKSGSHNSILDEVEGTLSATITELQELQPGWNEDGTYNSPPAQQRKPMEPPKSAPANQGYFTQGYRTQDSSAIQGNQNGSYSLPPTPLLAITPDESPSDDRLQSIQFAYDKQKRDMHTVLVENETLKRQLSLIRTRLADIDTIRIERDQFEAALQESQANLKIVLDKLRVSRENEEATLNNLSSITARLEEANMHRVDVLDHHQELQDKMLKVEKEKKSLQEEKQDLQEEKITLQAEKTALQEAKKALQEETATLRERPEHSVLEEAQNNLRKAEERAKHLEEQVKSGDGRADLPSIVAELGFKMEDLQRTVSEKDRQIADLETTSQALSKSIVGERTTFTSKVRGLEKTVAEQHKTFRTIQAERDQLRQLIHAEFRRTANDVQKRQHPATSLLEKKVEVDFAINETRRKVQEFLRKQKRRDEECERDTPQQRIEELEQEIDFHVKDIILYKLDVKGYKKDLKRAQAKLQKMNEPSLLSIFSSTNGGEQRPSVSTQSSTSTVPQVATSDSEPNSASTSSPTKNFGSPKKKGEEMKQRLSVHAYMPSGSPRESPATSPRKEKKPFQFANPSSS